MILPMPAMAALGGPPSPYALSRRPWVMFVLILQGAFCAARIVFFLDILGGFLMAIMIAIGWCAVREEINVQLLCYWGFMCLINGAFDLVKLIDVLVKTGQPLFSSHALPGYNTANFIALGIPISTLLGVPLVYWIYSDYAAGATAGGYQTEGSSLLGRGSVLGGGRSGGGGTNSSGGGTGTSRGSTTFTAFEGAGNRLGAA
eukprot:TRINITY_DN31712_c0_g1_i1.p1 TRINITY_DN31712_c0_g1~~TRINITY_DN31712_c0_g1_i1.p1  ORF type:complete len:202 (+),score=31.77 TRINITY_DN31712_c0_g1_i1:133-738(+)